MRGAVKESENIAKFFVVGFEHEDGFLYVKSDEDPPFLDFLGLSALIVARPHSEFFDE